MIIDCHYQTTDTHCPARHPATSIYEQPAWFMALAHEPKSDLAHALVEFAMFEIRRVDSTIKAVPSNITAIGAIVSDLFASLSDDFDGLSYRPLATDSFTGQRVGCDRFKRIVGALRTLKWVEVFTGYNHRDEGSAGPGRVTRFKALPAFYKAIGAVMLTGASHKDHFVHAGYLPSTPFVILKSASDRKEGQKIKGKAMKLDATHPAVSRNVALMNTLNSIAAAHVITLPGDKDCGPLVWRRIFQMGDDPNYAFDRGGRLYALGGHYQQLESRRNDVRQHVLIDGQPTVEIDLSSCFLTIAHSMAGVPLPTSELYDFNEIPRPVIKSYINNAFGLGHFPDKWSSTTRDAHREQGFLWNLSKSYPCKTLKQLVAARYPFLQDLFDRGMRSFDFEYVESEVMIATMLKLHAEHDCLALPVHDSIIVPASKVNVAWAVLSAEFERMTGIVPLMKVKSKSGGRA